MAPGLLNGSDISLLGGWRAVAIVLVLVYHSLIHADLSGHPLLARSEKALDHLGPFGVLVFFMISGYLITGRLIADHKKTGRFALGEFYYKRAFRILPLSYFYLLLILIAGLANLIQTNRADFSAAIFAANYVHGRSWYVGHFWSLSVEEHFYLLWPPTIALVGWRRAFWVGLAAMVAVGVWRPLELHHVADRFFALERTDMRLDFLMAGSITAIGVFHWPRFKAAVTRLGSPLGCICTIAILAISLAPFPFDTRSIQAIALAGLVCGTAMSRSPSIHRLLGNRPLLFLGQISYSLYILQQPFFAKAQNHFYNEPAVEFLKLGVVVGLAWISYNYLERPFIRYARTRLRKKEAREAQRPPSDLFAVAE